MPRKKRQSYDDKRKNVIAKLIFVSIVLVLVFLAAILRTLKPVSKTSRPEGKEISQEEVLNEHLINEDEIAQNVGKTIDTVKNQAEDTQGKLKGVSEKAIESGKVQAEKSISNFVYDTTLRPLIDKIHELPEDQQALIKEAVCK